MTYPTQNNAGETPATPESAAYSRDLESKLGMFYPSRDRTRPRQRLTELPKLRARYSGFAVIHARRRVISALP